MKILAVQTAFIGDLILSTPLYKGLKNVYPDAEIHVLAEKANATILKNNPHISKVIPFDKKNFWNKFIDILRLPFLFRKEKYDMSVSLQVSLTTSFLLYFSGIKKRVGYKRQKLLTHPVTLPKGLHIIKRIGLLLESIEKRDFDLTTELFYSDNDLESAKKYILDTDNKKLGISPGSVRITKMWLKEYFIELINKLPDSLDIYLIGGKGEYDLCNEIIRKTNKKNIVNVAGKLSLLESVALIDNMDLMLTNDSAPLHMADAVSTPVFAFFGPTVKRFGCYPYREHDFIFETELECRPCSTHGKKTCPEKHFRCMKDITPNSVLSKITDYLWKKN